MYLYVYCVICMYMKYQLHERLASEMEQIGKGGERPLEYNISKINYT